MGWLPVLWIANRILPVRVLGYAVGRERAVGIHQKFHPQADVLSCEVVIQRKRQRLHIAAHDQEQNQK
jgi:hypothetical protein